jgi:hypothetical protein
MSTSAIPFVGIYSFPKSGNTWMRQIIAALFFNDIGSIPDIYTRPIQEARPATLSDGRQLRFFKSHARHMVEKRADQVVPHAAIIYIMRHPLDVFLSYLNFLREDVVGKSAAMPFLIPIKSVDDLIGSGEIEMFMDAYILYGTPRPLYALSGGWFENSEYFWGKQYLIQNGEPVPVICLRYEDMVQDTLKTLEPVRNFLSVSEDVLEKKLQLAARRTKVDGSFYWKQRPGLYREMLPPKLIEKFARYHGDRTARLGYKIET